MKPDQVQFIPFFPAMPEPGFTAPIPDPLAIMERLSGIDTNSQIILKLQLRDL